jgi:hypothetical protein
MPAWVAPPYNLWSQVDDFVTPNNTTWAQVKALNLTWRQVKFYEPSPNTISEMWTPIIKIYTYQKDGTKQWGPAKAIWVKQAAGWTPVIL